MVNSIRKYVLIALSIALLMALAMPAMAQNRIIKGKVTNDKGEPVQGAEIKIAGTDVKREYSVKTDKKGDFFYMGLPFGEYRVIVRAAGYQPDFVQGVKPSISEERECNFKLNPGQDRKLPFEMSSQELEKVKEEAKKAEKQKQSSAEVKAAFDAGLALAGQGKYEEAVVEYKKALEKDSEQPYILANMADALSKLNKNEEALQTYEKAIALKPDDGAMYTNMGVLLGKLGKTAESQEAFKKAASVNPGAAGQNFYNLGATLVNSGKAAEAVEAFKQAIAADPNFAEAYFQLGICMSGNQATIPEAVKALQKYIEIGQKPDQVEVAKQLIGVLGGPPTEKGFKAEKKDDKKKKP
jgi:tetratricopeptide (TPR) repeat protein